MTKILAIARSAFAGPRGVLGGLLAAALVWTSWPSWGAMVERWSTDPRYAHGYLVPAFALVLLWIRRERFPASPAAPNWWGLPLLLAGMALQLAGAYYFFEWFEAASLLPTLAGVALLMGGLGALKWSWPSIGFLIFMIPLPFRLEGAMSHPLQRVGTIVSTYTLQTIGMPAVDEGNVIYLDDVKLGVVDACSGLGMLFTFVAMSAGAAILIRRPLLDRILILLSAAPIAIIANVLRITATGLAHRVAGSGMADLIFHDLAGWLMMPAALALMWAELWLLARLLVEPSPAIEGPIMATIRGSSSRNEVDRPRRGVADAVLPIVKNRSTKTP